MTNRSDRAIIAGAVAGGFAFLVMAGAGAWYVATHGVTPMTGDVASAVSGVAAAEYEPTSEWIEEGLDPDVTTFGFGANEGAERSNGPELSEEELRNLVYAKQGGLMECYADALAGDPELQGRVDMQFGIAPDGHVAMVRVTGSTLQSPTTEDCLVTRARDWSFPETNRATLMKFDTDFTFVYE